MKYNVPFLRNKALRENRTVCSDHKSKLFLTKHILFLFIHIATYMTELCWRIVKWFPCLHSLMSVLPTSQVFTSGYVNTETILHFFYKITNERASSCNEGKRRACCCCSFGFSAVSWILGKLNSKEKFGKSSSSITVLKTNLKKLSYC